MGELNGVDEMLWVFTAYILAWTIMMPLYGKPGDLLGRELLLLGAILVFMAGSVVGALAGNIEVLIAARAIQGLRGGLIILSRTAIVDVVPAGEPSGRRTGDEDRAAGDPREDPAVLQPASAPRQLRRRGRGSTAAAQPPRPGRTPRSSGGRRSTVRSVG